MSRDGATWERLARSEPAWAVLSSEAQRAAGEPGEPFWASGRAEVDSVFAALEAHELLPAAGDALDFGCGLGRLTRPLSERFSRTTGVDVSPTMAARARQLHPGCTFLVAEGLAGIPSASQDFVLSLIALQHVRSPDVIRAIVGDVVRILRPGGIAVVQIPAAVGRRVRWHPARLAADRLGPAWLRVAPRRLAGHAMALTPVPEAEVRASVAQAGGEVRLAVEDNRVGSSEVTSLAYVLTSVPRGGMAISSP